MTAKELSVLISKKIAAFADDIIGDLTVRYVLVVAVPNEDPDRGPHYAIGGNAAPNLTGEMISALIRAQAIREFGRDTDDGAGGKH